VIIITLKNTFDDREWTEERLKAVWELWPGIPQKYPELENFKRHQLPHQTLRATWEELQTFLERGVPVNVEAEPGTMLTTMRDKEAKGSLRKDFDNGKVVQFSIPDIGLLMIDHVTWLEDACTEELQTCLDAGWRILAVCPPNAQRRPDYILGRRGPEKNR
jgi:hypothetical protein